VPISIVGPRPGEKLVEEIVAADEESVVSAHPSIMVSRPPVLDPGELRRALREVEVLGDEGQSELLSLRMKELASGPGELAAAAEAGA